MRSELIQRLRFSRDFETLRLEGFRFDMGHFVVNARLRLPTESPQGYLGMRFGVIATKRLGNAPERNRAKRRSRELVHMHAQLSAYPVDIVLVLRRSVLKAPWDQLVEKFSRASRLVEKAILKEKSSA
ncbi:MAG TPA: ribonuclease P protein component [Opitutales bacterium]|nr:ribonuclease P protein component [Opitutales bacterium]